FGGRLLFLSDLWALSWVPLCWIYALIRSDAKRRNQLLFIAIGLSTLFALIFWHGQTRPKFNAALGFIVDEQFAFQRELAVTLRFLSWILGGVIVAYLGIHPSLLLYRTLAIATLISSLAIIVA